MILESTRGQAPRLTFADAVLNGLAPDGGLYLPTQYPRFNAGDMAAWRGLAFSDLATRLSARFLADEFDADTVGRLVGDAFDFPVPTVEVEPGRFVLELFHGPTLAFKDFGARFLARIFGHLVRARHEHVTILVATSGDTGSAVAHGFHGVPDVQVVVLYPKGKVSRFQEAQMATLGGNVTALAVPGVFDDCQRLVKSAFLDPALVDLKLSSANSINIGRLLPQSFYYVQSYLSVVASPGDPAVFSVPTGNVGNLTAGVIAARVGLPVERFIAATNANNVVTEYLETGIYRARPSIATLSNAMDVGDPSNFPRLLALFGGSFARMRERLSSTSVDEATTCTTIRDVYRRTGYLLDPHSAVGWAASERLASETGCRCPVVTLATAHPAKFGEVIERELGFVPALPDVYRDWAERPILAEDMPNADYETFRARLLRL
jgi:threonine synthase